MTVVFPYPLFPITSPRKFRGRKGLFSRLLAPDYQAYCLLIFIGSSMSASGIEELSSLL